MPPLFALFLSPLDNEEAALFAGFGAFAFLGFSDFGGPPRHRTNAYLALTFVGAVLVAVGTLLSNEAVLVAIVCAVTASTAGASRTLMKGIYDDANLLTGNPDQNYAILGDLRTKVVRLNLHSGGPLGVAGVDPTVRPTDPNDGQYDWSLYDRAVTYATQYGIQVVFSIVNTPTWANNGRGLKVAPTKMNDLRDFAYAAAKRYSGSFQRPQDGRFLPRVRYWLAWNEPNNPAWLTPQATRGRFVSPQTYAKMCNAVVTGIRMTTKSQ